MFRQTCVWRRLSVALVLVLCVPLAVLAAGGGPMPAPTPPPVAPPRPSPETEYNKGLQAKGAKRFSEAVTYFRRAVDLRPNFAEAWNELGFALRQIGQYVEAIRAYDEALRLRPNYPEALEYLGEAYVKLGRLDDARAILERLNPLDTARAQELAEAIRVGK